MTYLLFMYTLASSLPIISAVSINPSTPTSSPLWIWRSWRCMERKRPRNSTTKESTSAWGTSFGRHLLYKTCTIVKIRDNCMVTYFLFRDNSQCHRIIFVLHAMGVDAMIKSVKRMTPSKVTYRDVVNMDTYFKPLTTFILACNNAALDVSDFSLLELVSNNDKGDTKSFRLGLVHSCYSHPQTLLFGNVQQSQWRLSEENYCASKNWTFWKREVESGVSRGKPSFWSPGEDLHKGAKRKKTWGTGKPLYFYFFSYCSCFYC